MTGFQSTNINVLVTGATGFIGSHLCHELVQKGYRVFGLSHSGNMRSIESLLQQNNFHLLQADICDTGCISSMIEENNIGAVFHLAAQLPSADDLDDPQSSFDVNVRGTLTTLHAACMNKVTKFIYSSSIDVYLEPPQYLPVDERHPTRPGTHYGVGKLAGELYGSLYSNSIKVTVLRYSIVYGRGCKRGGAANRFIHQATNFEPLTIYGAGAQSNDFVYVGDVVQANLLALEQDKPGIYNIGSGEETSVKNLAQSIIKLTGSRSGIFFTHTESNKPFRFALDISLAQKALGYEPLTLSQGLSEYIKHFELKEYEITRR